MVTDGGRGCHQGLRPVALGSAPRALLRLGRRRPAAQERPARPLHRAPRANGERSGTTALGEPRGPEVDPAGGGGADLGAARGGRPASTGHRARQDLPFLAKLMYRRPDRRGRDLRDPVGRGGSAAGDRRVTPCRARRRGHTLHGGSPPSTSCPAGAPRLPDLRRSPTQGCVAFTNYGTATTPRRRRIAAVLAQRGAGQGVGELPLSVVRADGRHSPCMRGTGRRRSAGGRAVHARPRRDP